MFHFFIEKNGETLGPYSAKDMQKMQLPDDVWVTEDSLNGEWRTASEFDFDELVGIEFSDYDKPYDENENETDLNIYNDFSQQQPEEEVLEESGMTEEEIRVWREKRRRSDNRTNGLATTIVGLLLGGIGVLITALSGGSVIKIGLIGVGVFLILKGLIQLLSGEDDEDNQNK